MYTIVETPVFVRYAAEVWTEAELDVFKVWIANNPLSGDVIQGTGGMRKVRWSRAGSGKRGGARVIYYNQLTDGVIALFIVYTKAKFDNLPAAFLARLKKEFEDAQES
ncbi:transcriptional regulator [Variovorax sp. N23]|uniref:transcriptional regulator n=1 Tax=Variovorax sp. N23 TaxID=2980555 RepID=UPI0021C68A03|nr:transcriptional regulator [Variovorax sp. N23]MCU4120154.1 transcriptional regulator [Variovorax sp. N23]